jgi:transglutaminase-like putative cysteine protease
MRRDRLAVRLSSFLLLASSAFGSDEVARSRTVELEFQATVRDLPKRANELAVWLPMPRTDSNQVVHRVSIDGPRPVMIAREPVDGNESLHLRIDHPQGPVRVVQTITVTRRENAGARDPLARLDRERYLAPEPLVPLDGPVRELAIATTRGLRSDAEKARSIYDKVASELKYDKTGTGWGRGDALFACDQRRGNCTDFHALLIGMARSVGIPARFAIGMPLPIDKRSGEIGGYHCWAELYIDGRGWVPVDGSEAAKNPAKRDYFFGHHDENRVEFSRGRNLTLAPPQHGPPINFFVYPYAEVDGKPHDKLDWRVTFRDVQPPS